ncbi:MAG: signal peptidase I [bacterium]|nr:signal peptidase I [Candidatus Sumerlaeota bacterium]
MPPQKSRSNRRATADKPARDADSPLRAVAAADAHKGILLHIREWLDALVIAFVLAMFIRTFVVELFKIPSGSMSPTLLGDFIAEGAALDKEQKSNQYILIKDRGSDEIQMFRKDSKGHYVYEGKKWIGRLTINQRDMFEHNVHLEEHRILVCKFAYWFSQPDRGDIVVFRVPFRSEPNSYIRDEHRFEVPRFNRNQAVYVKRVVAFGGEAVEIAPDGQLVVNGKSVEEPPMFQHLRYLVKPEGAPDFKVKAPPGNLYVFGDNTDNSADSRYWDGVPYDNLRGKAFFRYWPWNKMRFLN